MDKIIMAHGSGGKATDQLINEIFEYAFHNNVLSQMEDSAVVEGSGKIALTTDSFVVTPLEFPGGDIGRLSICGTVNDLLMRGATPKYITCGFILEEGADIPTLKRIVESMAETAKEAGVMIVAGDTKVIQGNGGIYINTAGVGFIETELNICASGAKNGDAIIVSGSIGDHHATILSSRMNIENTIESDNAPLNEIVNALLGENIEVHTLRDVTRGGLGTVLFELSFASRKLFEINEKDIPVNPQVMDFCKILGLDPLYMGNEGKLVAIVAEKDSQKALNIIRNSKYGENAALIGTVKETDGEGETILITGIGGKRKINQLQGEGLPRIC